MTRTALWEGRNGRISSQVEDRFGLSWWDAFIVAAALRAECPWLLSEDLQDGQELFGTRVVDPFRHGPGEIP